MRINLASVFVDDQVKALAFYTDVLGFEKRTDLPVGEAGGSPSSRPRTPTASSSCSSPTGIRRSGRSSGRSSPTASRSRRSRSTDVAAEHARLAAAGVEFTQPPTAMGPVTTAVFDDTCGNLIQIASMASA